MLSLLGNKTINSKVYDLWIVLDETLGEVHNKTFSEAVYNLI